MKKCFNISFLLLLAFGFTSLSFAQGRQTGSISGVVADKEGNLLPGCTIILSGPKLLGLRNYITSDTGRFRFPSLSPGADYELRAEMPGFKTVIRPGLIIKVGKTTTVNLELDVSTIEENVTVTDEPPVVDIDSSKISVNYTADFIASIPINRDLYDIQNSIPGAVADGADYRRTSSILGGTVRSTLYALDGVPMNDPATWYSMANINIDVYEEMEVEIGAHPAEVGQTDSTYINIVTKSGGNKFSGGLTVYYTGEKLAQNLISKEDIEALNVDEPEKFKDYKDLSLNLGGPVLTDRVWFFLNGRRLIWNQTNRLVPETRLQNIADANPGMFTAVELEHYDLGHKEWLGFAKLTFLLSKNIRYTGMLHYNHIYEPVYSNRVGSSYSWAYTAVLNHENTYTTTHQVNWVLDQNTFLDIRGTYIHRYFPINSRDEFAGNYTFYDRKYAIYWGYTSYDDEYVSKKMLASASITRFQDDFFGASHEFKAGAEFEQTEYHRDWYRRGGNPYYSYWHDYNANDPYYYSTIERSGSLEIRMCPGGKGYWDIQDHTRRFSGFIQESAISGRLAINVGLRLDFSYQYEPKQRRPNLVDSYTQPAPLQNPALGTNDLLLALMDLWHEEIDLYSPWDELTTPSRRTVEFFTLSPRIGLVYDLFGDGKTALKASFSRYYEPIWSAKYSAAQIFGANSVSYYWYDLNRNKLMDLPGVDRYSLTGIPNQNPNIQYYVDNLKAPYTHELMAGIERELAKDFKLGLEFVYKVNKNIVESVDKNNGYDPDATDENGHKIWIPFATTDPGMDGEFGTSDDKSITVYGLREDRPYPSMEGTNPPEAKRKYWAAILTFDKRMSNKWQLKGSVLLSSFRGNTDPGYSATEGQSDMFDDPNVMINSYGSVAFDRPFQVKIMGSVILPLNFIVSAYFQHRSGSAWGRTFSRIYFPTDLPVQEAYISSIRAEADGARRNPSHTNMDLRVEKAFKLGNEGRLNFYVDIFNLGGRSGININQNPNGWLRGDQAPLAYTLDETYGLVTSVYGIRSIRFGLRWSF